MVECGDRECDVGLYHCVVVELVWCDAGLWSGVYGCDVAVVLVRCGGVMWWCVVM